MILVFGILIGVRQSRQLTLESAAFAAISLQMNETQVIALMGPPVHRIAYMSGQPKELYWSAVDGYFVVAFDGQQRLFLKNLVKQNRLTSWVARVLGLFGV